MQQPAASREYLIMLQSIPLVPADDPGAQDDLMTEGWMSDTSITFEFSFGEIRFTSSVAEYIYF
ncbi:hypothetical protein NQZ68_011497, partial [Dissostichus eleginoides]